MKHLSASDRERLADLIVYGSAGKLLTRSEIRVRIVKILGRLQR